jgi:hypothetical protein
MKIKMPIKFHGNYVVSIRCGDEENRERCQKLTMRALSAEEQDQSYKAKGVDEAAMPTHQITFYDFGCKRIIEGKLIKNEDEQAVFLVQDKEYGFAPFRPRGA